MLIDVGLPAICVILPPAPSLLQEDSSDACVSIDALASAAERLRSHGQAGSNPKVRLADDTGVGRFNGGLGFRFNTSEIAGSQE